MPGGALGAALIAYHHHLDMPVPTEKGRGLQQGSYLGPEYDNSQIREFLEKHQLPHRVIETEQLLDDVSDLLQQDKVIGWYQGRMEFGPRALGNRSIIGDARSSSMQKKNEPQDQVPRELQAFRAIDACRACQRMVRS